MVDPCRRIWAIVVHHRCHLPASTNEDECPAVRCPVRHRTSIRRDPHIASRGRVLPGVPKIKGARRPCRLPPTPSIVRLHLRRDRAPTQRRCRLLRSPGAAILTAAPNGNAHEYRSAVGRRSRVRLAVRHLTRTRPGTDRSITTARTRARRPCRVVRRPLPAIQLRTGLRRILQRTLACLMVTVRLEGTMTRRQRSRPRTASVGEAQVARGQRAPVQYRQVRTARLRQRKQRLVEGRRTLRARHRQPREKTRVRRARL